MPRYFFHQVFADERIEDLEGEEFPNLETAQAQAILAAHELMADRVSFGKNVQAFTFEICCPEGKVLSEMPFLDAARSSVPFDGAEPRFKVTL